MKMNWRANAVWNCRSTVAALVAASSVAAVSPALAEVDLSASASAGIEHNTNVFDLSNGETSPFAGVGNLDRDDTAKRLSANAGAVIGGEGPFHAQLGAQFSRLDSNGFKSLDYTQHSLNGSIDWKPSPIFDVSAAASETRLPLSLADVGGVEAVLQKSRQAQTTLRLRPMSSWQIGISPGWTRTETPLPAAQNFTLRQHSMLASLDFLGAGALVPGVTASKAKGTNSGIADATRYTEESVQGTLNYKATGQSTFNLAAGHTKRTTRLIVPTLDPLNPTGERTNSSFTGKLSYQRQLSVKTGISISAFRDFQQYDAGVNTAVGTGIDAGVTWAATAKLSASLVSRQVWLTINDLRVAGTVQQRKDLERSYSFAASYAATQVFSLRTYYTRRIRTSDGTSADQFHGAIAGLELTAKIN